jgi:hypothetical protein
MAFPLGACSFLSERRACAPPIGEGYPADAANGKPGRRASHLRRDARGERHAALHKFGREGRAPGMTANAPHLFKVLPLTLPF